MNSVVKHTILLIFLLFLLTLEHTIGLPFLTCTFAIFLFASSTVPWRNLLFMFGSILLAIVYGLPFWLSFVLFFCLRATIEFFPLDHRYEDVAIVGSILIATTFVGIWVQYPLTFANSVVVGVQILLFGLIMVYFVRQKQPHQRLKKTYAN